MSATSYHLGHPIVYRRDGWHFMDDNAPLNIGCTVKLPKSTEPSVEATDHNVCRHCGRPPTPEGYDACLGHIPGALAACCGHGVEAGYVMMPPWGDQS